MTLSLPDRARPLLRRLALGLVCTFAGAAAGAADGAAAPRWAALTQVGFQHLTQDQGLPHEIGVAVAEDRRGLLWIGTDGGVARWDGYRAQAYRHLPGTPGSLPDNLIQAVHADAAGRVWFGTSAAGLVRYDAASDRFVTYPVGAGGIAHVSVHAIADDGTGGLWVASDDGIDHVDPASGRIEALPADAGLGRVPVLSLLRDRRGALWVGTSVGLLRRSADSAAFERVALPADGTQAPSPLALAEDSAGRVWIGTRQHGAFVVDADGGAARPVHESGADDDGSLARLQVPSIAEVRPGEVWLGTGGRGIVAVDTASGRTRRIRRVATLPASLSDDTVRAIYRDRAGLVWVATDHGLSRHDPQQDAVLTMYGELLPDGTAPGAPPQAGIKVSALLPRPDGRVWLATHRNGVDIVDPAQGLVGALRPDPSHPESALPPDLVLGLAPAADGSVFVATKRGLYRAAADGTRVRRVALAGRALTSPVWTLLADGPTLWLGGQEDGLWRVDPARGQAQRVLGDGATALADQRIVTLAPAPGGRLWVGTRSGLALYDPARGRLLALRSQAGVPAGAASGFVTSIVTDRRGRTWVGSYGGGVDILDGAPDAAAPRWRHLGTAEGLPEANINALVDDGDGRVWVSTDNGIAQVDPDTLAVRVLRRADGIAFSTYWTGAAARTADGELLFGAAGGMTIVQPARLPRRAGAPPVVATALRVGGRSLPAGAFDRREAPPITVPAQANSLAVEFAALDYAAPERLRYAYRLEGYDADWIEVDAAHRVAAYTNLPPGRYRLQLRGSDRDGAWSATALSLPVRVQAAWYQTAWFRVGAALAALAAVVGIVRVRTRLLRRRQAELEHKVRERTAELEQVTQELREKSRVLELTAISDPLTGLRNRRFLTDHIDTEIAASQRRALDARALHGGGPVDTDSVFFVIDIDHFKSVNDRFGHPGGDTVLVEFARRLQSVMRESDHVVRWGGEEFLAVARDTDRARADELAERIRSVVADTPFALDGGSSLAVTCSIGFASLPFLEHDPRALGWPDVMRLADLALFAAKRAGRNAWVGVAAGPQARAERLVDRIQADPLQALHDGLLRVSSCRPAAEAQAALAPQPAAAPAVANHPLPAPG